MNYTILHIEDYDEEKGIDYSKELQNEAKKNNLTYDWTDNLKNAKEKINGNQFDVFILDGQFPEEKGAKPNKNNFFKIYSFIINKGIKKESIIAWSNSTTVHNYCFDNGIACFSKKDMKPEDYTKKGNDPSKIVKKIDVKDLIKEIMNKIKK